tara:strand:+ start:810 stop:2372 length:1563 start_codon:yes stop_codon:yes gene_type:complete
MKFNKFNLITLVVIFFLAVLYSIPNLFNNFKFNSISSILPGKTVNLGLDLKGGSYLLLKAELESVFNEKLDNTSAQIRKSLRKNKIKYKNLRTVDNRISFNIRNSNDKRKVLSLIKEYSKDFLINDQKNYFYLNLSESGINSITKSTMQQAIEIVRRRIDESGTKEPLIQQQGKDRILVQLPGIDDPDRIKRLLGKTAKLTFRFTHPEMTTETLSLSSLTPPGYILLNEQKDKNKFYMIQKKVMVSGEELTDAKAAFDQDGNPAVMFTLTTSGGKKFGRITGKNIGRPFAIILDNRVISAPIIQGQIFSNGQITGNFSVQEANDLALVLRAGALPVPLNILEERTVGPGLGNDSIEAGKFASIIAIIAVIIFMIISYGFYGIFANLALVTNMIFIIALLSVLQATLTLPGIAGIVLTIGMAVDANVLIFERIKEEFRVRKELLSSVENGFQKAVSTIIDANLTTFFAAFALFIFGSGPIKGFSVTLMIGLITSMYTAIVLTKFLTTAYVKRKVEKLNVQI